MRLVVLEKICLNVEFWKLVHRASKKGTIERVEFVSVEFYCLITCNIYVRIYMTGLGSSAGIATDYGLDGPGIESWWGARFSARPDRPLGPPSLLYNGYRVFPGGKVQLRRAADHSPPSSAEVLEE